MTSLTKKFYREQNLIKAEFEIGEIEDAGHRVQRFGDYHWRIDDAIDVWPSSKKYMKGKRVKRYEEMEDIFKN